LADWWIDDPSDDDTEPETTTPPGPQLPNKARQHMRKIEKENQELKDKLAKLELSQRKTSVSEIIKAKGYDPKISAFVPKEIDSTDEAVGKWLEDFGGLFAKTGAEDTQDAKEDEGKDDAVAPDIKAALAQLSNAASGGMTPKMLADLDQQMKNAKTEEELFAIMRKQGAPI
jgi:hypothetical protein